VRQSGPFILVALLGVVAGVIIGLWMGSTSRVGSVVSGRSDSWRGRGRWSDERDAAKDKGRPADAGWSVAQHATSQPPATGAAATSPTPTERQAERQTLGRDSQTSDDSWKGVGPGLTAEPATPEFASRTVRND
jgi:hypothetical protein